MNVKQMYDQDTHATAPDTPESLDDETVDTSRHSLHIFNNPATFYPFKWPLMNATIFFPGSIAKFPVYPFAEDVLCAFIRISLCHYHALARARKRFSQHFKLFPRKRRGSASDIEIPCKKRRY